MRKFLSFVFLALPLVGLGCTQTKDNNPKPVGNLLDGQAQVQATLPSGFERRNVSYEDGREVSWVTSSFKPDAWHWSLAENKNQPMDVKEWRDYLNTNLVINGAYFKEDYAPSGFYQTASTTQNKWPDQDEQANENSYSGMLRIKSGSLELSYLVARPQAQPNKNDQVLLTYPTLIADGKPIVKEDSHKLARRTILAQDVNGTIHVYITEQGAVSLYEASQWLATQEEKISIAINLDGGPSTGIAYRDGSSKLDILSGNIPNVIAASKK